MQPVYFLRKQLCFFSSIISLIFVHVLTNRIYSEKIPTVSYPLEEEQAPWTEGKNVLVAGESY